jgi:hypothetical protein
MAKTKIIIMSFIKKNIHFIILYILIITLALVVILEVKKLNEMNYQLKSEVVLIKDKLSDYNTIDNYSRYAIYLHPVVRADQYLLDTKTGRIWQCYNDPKTKTAWWKELDVQNNKDSITEQKYKRINEYFEKNETPSERRRRKDRERDYNNPQVF